MTTTVDGLARIRRMCRSGAAAMIRSQAGVSLAEVGVEAEVAPSTILRWERAEHMPHGEPALRYLAALERLAEVSR